MKTKQLGMTSLDSKWGIGIEDGEEKIVTNSIIITKLAKTETGGSKIDNVQCWT